MAWAKIMAARPRGLMLPGELLPRALVGMLMAAVQEDDLAKYRSWKYRCGALHGSHTRGFVYTKPAWVYTGISYMIRRFICQDHLPAGLSCCHSLRKALPSAPEHHLPLPLFHYPCSTAAPSPPPQAQPGRHPRRHAKRSYAGLVGAGRAAGSTGRLVDLVGWLLHTPCGHIVPVSVGESSKLTLMPSVHSHGGSACHCSRTAPRRRLPPSLVSVGTG